MCGPLAEQIAFEDRIAAVEYEAMFADRARAEVAARRLLLSERPNQPADDCRQGEGVV